MYLNENHSSTQVHVLYSCFESNTDEGVREEGKKKIKRVRARAGQQLIERATNIERDRQLTEASVDDFIFYLKRVTDRSKTKHQTQ